MTIWSARTTYQGRAINQGTKQILDALNKMVRTKEFGAESSDVSMSQGGYNRGGVAASAGTHDGGGAFDLSDHNWANRVRALRILGCASWHRPKNWDNRGGGAHVHSIVTGDGTASSGAKSQVSAYLAGRNGLANNAKDADKRPKVLPILFHLDGNMGRRYAKVACHVYAEPNTSSTNRGTVAVGESFVPVAVVNVAGGYWFVTAEGFCGFEDNFTTTAPSTTPPTKPPVVVTPPVETEPPVADSCTFNYLGFNIYASQYTGGSFSSKRKAELKSTFSGTTGANASWNSLSEVNRDLDHNTVVALLGSQFNHKDVYTRAAGNNHHYPDANKWEVTGRLILPLGSTTTQARRITLVTAKHKATGIIASFWAAHFSSATSGASSAQAAASQIVEAKAVAKLIKSNTLPDWDVAKSIGYADTNFDAAEQHIEPAGVKEIAKLVTVADGQFNSLHTLGKAPSKGFRRDNVFVGSKVEVLKARQIMGLYDASDHLGQACQLRVSA